MTLQPSDPTALPDLPASYTEVRDGLVEAIKATQGQAITSVNVLRNVSYLMTGRALDELQPDGHGAKYGKRVVEQMSRDLTASFGSQGFSPTNLRYARRFAAAMASPEICPQLGADLGTVPLMRLGWGHIKVLLDSCRAEPSALSWVCPEFG